MTPPSSFSPDDDLLSEEDKTIAQLFAEDPLKLSSQSIFQMVEKFRAMRGRFNLGVKTAGASAKAKKKEVAKLSTSTSDLASRLNLTDML